jgi:hypothetical protein
MKIVKIIILTVIVCLIFSFGFIFGYYFNDDDKNIKNRQQGHRDIALYIYGEIENKFGSIKPSDDDYKNIIDEIDFYDDLGFSILEENGVKTIRVYKYDQK